jgi:N-acylneuraminate cytidylyltransferase/CMP-N,N'-diacetyllegionaminic acid synthase
MHKVLAVIPARGGSKSIPKKNIASAGGRPLIAWTIIAAQAAEAVDRIVVSTDAEEIADVARQYGVEVPFLRPSLLAQDDTPGLDPILHAVQWLKQHDNYCADFVLCLQPTSPLRSAKDIDAAIELALGKNADAVVSVTPAAQHPYWMKLVDAQGLVHEFISLEGSVTRRQGLPHVYALNGAIYLARIDVILERKTWYTDKTYAHIMPLERSLDVDEPWDLHVADLILRDKYGAEIS